MKNQNKHLTQFQKGQIIAWWKSKVSKREIGKRLSKSDRTIRYFIKQYETRGTSERKIGSGRLRKTSLSEDKLIKKQAI